MTEYIRQLLDEIYGACEVGREHAPIFKLLPEIVRELDRLDPRDFAAAGRAQFVRLLSELRWISEQTKLGDLRQLRTDVGSMVQTLRLFEGEGARGVQREFGFLVDAGLRDIVLRDYRELTLCLLPSPDFSHRIRRIGPFSCRIMVLKQITQVPDADRV